MQPAVLRALEFDRIREALAHEAATPLGRERALALEPAVDAGEVRARLALTTEAAQFERDGSLALSAPDDLEAIFEGLEVDGRPLDPVGLLGLARFLESVDEVAAAIRRKLPPSIGLAGVAARAASFSTESSAVRRAITPAGEVTDDASPALRDIRDKLRKQRAKLRTTLEGLTRGRDTAKYLQDQIVADRNGRYVVVVRAEHREAIPGIVHGSSTSGASLYLEPLATVSLNNDIVSLAEREKEEVFRILLALTDAYRHRDVELAATIDAAADFDELHAKAGLARRVDGVAPALADDGRLELRGARHPLLIPAMRDVLEQGERRDRGTVVATDILIVPPVRALVISGPNTGGKTVALKAAGLLAVMAQAGLLIPVEPGSTLTPFRSVFADIGDEQSISASLSTFSARIANLVEMERALELPALVLLDEVGSGTDPVEGGALGTAVIDHFRKRGATVLATTHDDGLKSFAATTEGVATAAFGFEPETYAPTYRLIYGAPGRSLALEIAQRLGMPAGVIAAARERRSARESQLAEHLARVDKEIALLDRERQLAEADRQTLAEERQKLFEREAKVVEREAVLRKRLDDRVHEKLREAKDEVEKIVGRLKQKADTLATEADKRVRGRQPPITTGEIGGLRAEGRAALADIGATLGTAAPPPEADTSLSAPPAVGDTVLVAPFGAEGIVRAISGKQVEVEIRGKRMRVKLDQLRAASKKGPGGHAPARGSGGVQVDKASRPDGGTRDLVLIGQTVDQAIDRAEKFLDDALLTDERRLRVVHGHGTGRLRDALTKFFKAHPLVASVAPAPDNEGGTGATIVELKD